MYAIVEIGGFQFKVVPDEVIRVPLINAEVGNDITLDRVILWADDNDVEVGTPVLEGKQLTAEVLAHGRDKKIIVFKKKRRKKYRRKNGHRQGYTEIRLNSFA